MKYIEENQGQSQIITGKHLPLWNLSLIRKIILIIFTTANNCLNPVHCLLMAFSDLEKKKTLKFFRKHFTGTHTNIEQKPYRASLSYF